MSTNENKTNEESGDQEALCPICFEQFQEPILCSCGHVYCKKCIEDWVKVQVIKNCVRPECPLCKCLICMDDMDRVMSNANDSAAGDGEKIVPILKVLTEENSNNFYILEDSLEIEVLDNFSFISICNGKGQRKRALFYGLNCLAQNLTMEVFTDDRITLDHIGNVMLGVRYTQGGVCCWGKKTSVTSCKTVINENEDEDDINFGTKTINDYGFNSEIDFISNNIYFANSSEMSEKFYQNNRWPKVYCYANDIVVKIYR